MIKTNVADYVWLTWGIKLGKLVNQSLNAGFAGFFWCTSDFANAENKWWKE